MTLRTAESALISSLLLPLINRSMAAFCCFCTPARSFACFFFTASSSFCCFLAVFWKPFSCRSESTVIGSNTSGGSVTSTFFASVPPPPAPPPPPVSSIPMAFILSERSLAAPMKARGSESASMKSSNPSGT
uniref:Putative secreted peptide n=1 Tax=Anopheles braziliensis TaxID=58242 RepID=A0A2M3ZMU6_9DIPT